MFKFIHIPEADLEKIFQIRTKREGTTRLFHLSADEQPQELTFPHQTYSLGMNALKNEEQPTPEKTGTRVIEATNNNFNFIYDLATTSEDSQPQMSGDPVFLAGYENAFNHILGTDMEDKNYEVRTLKIPALHIETLWLHHPDATIPDQYIPVRTIGRLTSNKIYSQEEFFAIVKDESATYDIDDDMKGG